MDRKSFFALEYYSSATHQGPWHLRISHWRPNTQKFISWDLLLQMILGRHTRDSAYTFNPCQSDIGHG